ncbi:MAG: rhodanese-related sulfurtransferase [Erysipelothrix sp.]|nr:rhodanese-related sulfurtransferase [Erysipelothrix sp.]
MVKDYRVLLYYHYVDIEDTQAFRDAHYKLCTDLGLLGRIIISSEGMNGTVSGTIEQTQGYIDAMNQDPMFKDMPFKMDYEDKHAFSKMHVRVKNELVNLGLEKDVNPLEVTGTYLKPSEFYEYMQDENTVVLDARNDYEYDLGHFRGAIRPDIRVFRDLPQWIKENDELLEGKKILTYCTGGVRCEKFSGWLKEEGFEDVNQLEGGIVTYGYDEEVQGKLWDGQLYVFDQRISVPVNRVEPTVVGKDYYTSEPCERYVNCANPDCNRQMLMSEETEAKYLRACSDTCRRSGRNRYVIENKLTLEELELRYSLITN